jgi:hypothetical protein
MTSADDAIRRWADIMEGKTDRRPLRASNVFVEGDRVYSYGHHFELARPLRDKKGKVHAYLLNGDTYSVTTSKHQWSVRNALTGKDTVIIPYSALEAAGVDRDSIRVLGRLEDRTEVRRHHTETFPEGAKWHTEDVWGRAEGETYSSKVGTRQVLRAGRAGWTPVIEITRHADGSKSYDWETNQHRLGESLIRGRVDWTARKPCQSCHGTGWGIGPTLWRAWIDCPDCRGNGMHRTRHHRWATFLSGFDHQEARPLYFFCEMPYGCKAATVAEAYEALKPDPVKLAEQMGRNWTRQGDIFAVPTRLDRKALVARGARLEKRSDRNSPRQTHLPYILNTNHTATEVAYLPGGLTLARGVLYHDPSFRDPDHARRKLGDGKTWHIVVKNTVPITGRR